MNIEYDEGSISEHWQAVKEMFENHWDEVGFGDFDLKCRIDWAQLMFLEAKGLLLIYGARDKDTGEVIAYLGAIINYHPFMLGKKIAYTSGFYLKPEYRKGLIGYKLLKNAEKYFKEKKGIDFFQIGNNINFDISPLLKRLGYQKTDELYTKQLKG